MCVRVCAFAFNYINDKNPHCERTIRFKVIIQIRITQRAWKYQKRFERSMQRNQINFIQLTTKEEKNKKITKKKSREVLN